MKEIKVGSKVRYLGCNGKRQDKVCSPPVGTIGVVSHVDYDDNDVLVQWPAGTTSEDDQWWCLVRYLELVEEDTSAVSKAYDTLKKDLLGKCEKLDKLKNEAEESLDIPVAQSGLEYKYEKLLGVNLKLSGELFSLVTERDDL